MTSVSPFPRSPRSSAGPGGPPARELELSGRVLAVAQELLDKLGMEGTVQCRVRSDGSSERLWVEIESRQSGILIGERGSTLRAFEHILHLLLRSTVGGSVRVSADVNTYRLQRAEALRRQAEAAAERARTTGRAVVLEPMEAPDRRIIHVVLADNRGVHTESQGEEPRRRVVVRPRDPLA